MLKAYINSIKIPELRKRIFFTVGILAVCRLAASIPVPGIDPQGLSNLFEQLNSNAQGSGVMGMINIFSGGALQNFAIAALGIMPYISASIVMQLLTPIVPSLEKLHRDEQGRQELNQITRYLTILICIIQGWMLAVSMESPVTLGLPDVQIVTTPGFAFKLMTVLILMAGTLILMWLGEQITEKGIGNGVSIIITVNIISRLPQACAEVFGLLSGTVESDFTLIHFLLLIIFFLIITAGTVALNQGVRQVPIRYANRRGGSTSNIGQTTYMPLKVNFSGVMPLIFAGAVLMFASLIIGFCSNLGSGVAGNVPAWKVTISNIANFVAPYFNYDSISYLVFYAICIILFTFFWVANQFNPIRMADDLKRGGAYIPGIRPGELTAEYLDHSMTYITVIGVIGLIILAIIPNVLATKLGVSLNVAAFFGGSSLLIIVGVTLDAVRQMESILVARNYDGFLSKGRLRGRNGM